MAGLYQADGGGAADHPAVDAEPDFGATVVTVATAFGMLFLAGVRLAHFMLVVLGSCLALVLLVVSEPYRLKRLTAYTDPWADQFNSGYQLTQSLDRLRSRRVVWRRPRQQRAEAVLPARGAHRLCVFHLAEETGLVGALLVIALFLALVYRRRSRAGTRSWRATASAPSSATAWRWIASQAFINIGVSTGLLPTKGLTLPLVSYGGSSLITCCAMIAPGAAGRAPRPSGR